MRPPCNIVFTVVHEATHVRQQQCLRMHKYILSSARRHAVTAMTFSSSHKPGLTVARRRVQNPSPPICACVFTSPDWRASHGWIAPPVHPAHPAGLPASSSRSTLGSLRFSLVILLIHPAVLGLDFGHHATERQKILLMRRSKV